MAENRDELEQAAMLLLSKDKKEEALEVYLKLLKLSKGDIRVRSKLADLYLSMDRKPEAIRQLRDVSAGQIKEGQFPPGYMISPGIRAWQKSEIDSWLDERMGRNL